MKPRLENAALEKKYYIRKYCSRNILFTHLAFIAYKYFNGAIDIRGGDSGTKYIAIAYNRRNFSFAMCTYVYSD